MARADGSFPKYTRLELSLEDSPPDYWTAGARKCMRCNKLWPALDAFKQAPCCNSETNRCKRVHDLENPGAMKNAIPEMTWRQAYRELMEFRFELLYFIWNEGITDEQLYLLATEQVDESIVALEMASIDDLLTSS